MSTGGAGWRWRTRIVFGAILALAALVSHRAGASREGARGALEATATPRELSAAERAAVDLAVAYLEKGPAGWWDRLAAGAPLRRLGRAAALDEIAARVGPAEGATWQLLTPGRADPQRAVLGIEYPSGLDETLTLQLVDEGGWKLAELRTTIDPVAAGPVIPTGPAPATLRTAPPAPATEPAAESAAPANPSDAAIPAYLPLLTLGVAALALVLGALGAFLLGRSGRGGAAAAAGIAALVIAGGAVYWGWSLGGRRLAAAPASGRANKTAGRGAVASLAQLRAALAAGTDRAEIERQLAAPAVDAKQRNVQTLWRAQYLLGEGDLNGADAILRGFPDPAPYPLAELLRARLAFRRLRRDETGWLYQTAIGRGHDDDGLRLEAAFASASTDAEDRAEGEFADMVNMGTRLAEPWYIAAQIAASQDRMDDAETFLRLAWKLEPAPRADLFRNPLLSLLVARPKIFPLFQLGSPDEARVAPEGDRQPLALPAGAKATTCGQTLRLAVGGAELLVPGGALLAPADAAVEDADTWKRHSEAKALAALPTVKAQATAAGGLQPQLLRIAEQAGRALAEQNRWSDLVDLTQPIAPKVESAPATLVRLRAQALHRLQRDDEARQLLVRLAKTDLAGRRPSTGTLFDLAELFAASGEYDTAIKLLEKADSQLPEPRALRRRRQLAMDRELASSYETFRSEHFEVRYPKATGERYARQVSWVLEQERIRLQHWIPPAGGKLIEVHLFPYRDFYTSFGGDIAVVGLFDGKMRVPFAEMRSLDPRLVAVLSHELAHALMSAATGGQAPHWLQEGLAQHIEMGTRRVNPLPDLARTGRALSFPTVDPILRGFAEERFVGLAYSEAAWAVAFIESRYGDKAIPRLLTAFAAGKTNEQALKEVCGLTPAEFDRAFWAWGAAGPQVRALEARRYDVDYDRQERHEHTVESPHAGLLHREEIHRQELADEKRERMVLWHAIYAQRTDGIKRSLRPILNVFDGQSDAVHGSIASACGELSTQVGRVLADPEPWSSLDADVNRALRDAYILIGNMGDACRTGRDAEARALIGQLNASLAKAAEHLEPYGLTP